MSGNDRCAKPGCGGWRAAIRHQASHPLWDHAFVGPAADVAFTGTCGKCGELIADGRTVHRACEPSPAAQGDQAVVREIAERWAAGGLRDEVAIPMLAASREAYAAGRDAGAVLAADVISEWMQLAREIGFDAGRAQGAREVLVAITAECDGNDGASAEIHGGLRIAETVAQEVADAIAARGKDGPCTT